MKQTFEYYVRDFSGVVERDLSLQNIKFSEHPKETLEMLLATYKLDDRIKVSKASSDNYQISFELESLETSTIGSFLEAIAELQSKFKAHKSKPDEFDDRIEIQERIKAFISDAPIGFTAYAELTRFEEDRMRLLHRYPDKYLYARLYKSYEDIEVVLNRAFGKDNWRGDGQFLWLAYTKKKSIWQKLFP